MTVLDMDEVGLVRFKRFVLASHVLTMITHLHQTSGKIVRYFDVPLIAYQLQLNKRNDD